MARARGRGSMNNSTTAMMVVFAGIAVLIVLFVALGALGGFD